MEVKLQFAMEKARTDGARAGRGWMKRKEKGPQTSKYIHGCRIPTPTPHSCLTPRRDNFHQPNITSMGER